MLDSNQKSLSLHPAVMQEQLRLEHHRQSSIVCCLLRADARLFGLHLVEQIVLRYDEHLRELVNGRAEGNNTGGVAVMNQRHNGKLCDFYNFVGEFPDASGNPQVLEELSAAREWVSTWQCDEFFEVAREKRWVSIPEPRAGSGGEALQTNRYFNCVVEGGTNLSDLYVFTSGCALSQRNQLGTSQGATFEHSE